MTQLKRVAQWLKSLAAPSITPETEAFSALEFDPAWHGDHWQNLLASPLDARHYVMEDWTYTPPPTETEEAAPSGKRKRRSYAQ